MIGKQDRYIKKKLDEIFCESQRIRDTLSRETLPSQEERDAVFSFFLMLADEVDYSTLTVWRMKVAGIIQFLRWAGRITEEQDEMLWMLMNEVIEKKGV